MRSNEYGQPIGRELPEWSSRPIPSPTHLDGAHVVLEPLDVAAHLEGLDAAFRDAPASLWTYLPYGPFGRDELERQLSAWVGRSDPQFSVILDRGGGPVGWAALQRFDPHAGSMEVAHVCYSPALQRTIGATEAMWLLMRHAFDTHGYRRYEWKCDDLNAPSRSAAERLGFRFEGVFRNHMVYRGRNRDTAWFSITDREWPPVDRALRGWLARDNHLDGRQKRSLSEFMPPST